MLTLSEFWRGYAPAHAEHCDPRTHAEYQTTIKLAVELLDDPPIDHLNLLGSVFVRDAIKRELSAVTGNLTRSSRFWSQRSKRYARIDCSESAGLEHRTA